MPDPKVATKATTKELKADLELLRQACLEGSQDLPRRLMRENSQLEWKPGVLGQGKALVNNYIAQAKRKCVEATGKRKAEQEAEASRAAAAEKLYAKTQESPSGMPYRSSTPDPNLLFGEAWESPTGAPRSRMNSQSERIEGSGPLKDLYEAMSRGGLQSEVMAAASQTPSIAYEIAGLSRTPPPTQDDVIAGFAELLVDSGLIGDTVGEVGAGVAIDIAGALPWIGVAVCLSQGTRQELKSLCDLNRARKANAIKPIFTPGFPQTGLHAVKELFQRHAAESAARGSINHRVKGARPLDVFDMAKL
jgi:hypothetical protein